MIADFNGDGRDDVVSNADINAGIAIRLATPGQVGLAESQKIAHEGQLIGVADADLDGDADVFGMSSQLFWLENDGDAGFIRHDVAGTISMAAPRAAGFQTGDVEGDGTMDAVYLANAQQLITVLNISNPMIIVSEIDTIAPTSRLQLAHISPDGSLTAYLDAGHASYWLAWTNIGFVPRQQPEGLEPKGKLTFLDLDHDLDAEVVSITDHVRIYEMMPDGTRFELQNTLMQRRGDINSELLLAHLSTDARVGDYDGDGLTDLFLADVIGGGGEAIDFYVALQTPESGIVVAQQMFGHPATNHGQWGTGDIGGTSCDQFIFATADGGVSIDGSKTYDVASPWYDVDSIGTADLDQDGDLDIVTSATYVSDFDFPTSKLSLLWYENLDGAGTFGPAQAVSDEPTGSPFKPEGWIALVDWDQDTLVDIVGNFSGSLYWNKNLGTDQGFAPREILFENQADFPTGTVSDLDQDGLPEIIGYDSRHGSLLAFEQAAGSTTLTEPQQLVRLPTLYITALREIDFNGDGLPDLLASDTQTSSVVWFENQGNGQLTDAAVITDVSIVPPIDEAAASAYRSADAGDLDGDGDLDLLLGLAAGVYWSENVNGAWSVAARLFTTEIFASMTIADLNQDGNLDWVSATQHGSAGLRWHEQRVVGDANGDGQFDVNDLIELFAVNQYEDGVESNSTYVTGDFNGDGEFNSGDLVYAFQAGTYV